MFIGDVFEFAPSVHPRTVEAEGASRSISIGFEQADAFSFPAVSIVTTLNE